MGDDIREIEIQNRALQILNTNQLALMSELDHLLVSIHYCVLPILIHNNRMLFLYPNNAWIACSLIQWIQLMM